MNQIYKFNTKRGWECPKSEIEFCGECSHTRFACYSVKFSKPTKFDFCELGTHSLCLLRHGKVASNPQVCTIHIVKDKVNIFLIFYFLYLLICHALEEQTALANRIKSMYF